MKRAALRLLSTAALLLSALGRTDLQPLTAISRCALHAGDGRWLAPGSLTDANGTLVAARNAERCERWAGEPHAGPADLALPRARRQGSATRAAWAWSPEASRVCSLRALPRSQLTSLLRGVRVGVLGDSVARLFYAALLRAVGLSPEQRIVTGHRSFTHSLASGAHGSFVWAPYGENISAALRGWHAAGTAPDIVVAGASLWHMLHVGERDDYAASLRDVRDAMLLLRDGGAPSGSAAAVKRHRMLPPLFFWMSTTALATHKLPTEEKRTRLTAEAVAAYNALAVQEQLLLPSGPCVPLDVHRITQGAWHVIAAYATITCIVCFALTCFPGLWRGRLWARVHCRWDALRQRHLRRAGAAVGEQCSTHVARCVLLFAH